MTLKSTNFTAFIDSLKEEFDSFPKLVTEDYIRRLFIENYSGKGKSEIEVPYSDKNNRFKLPNDACGIFLPTSKRNDLYKRGDLYIQDCDCAVEFKFHKKTDDSELAHSDNFGYVVNDMNRLSLLKNDCKLLVYVFDQNMYNYYKKDRCPGLCDIQGAEFNSSVVFDKMQGNEFIKCAFTGFQQTSRFDYNVKVICSHDFTSKATNFYLRIYEIV